jgi:hypothetical protein
VELPVQCQVGLSIWLTQYWAGVCLRMKVSRHYVYLGEAEQAGTYEQAALFSGMHRSPHKSKHDISSSFM